MFVKMFCILRQVASHSLATPVIIHLWKVIYLSIYFERDDTNIIDISYLNNDRCNKPVKIIIEKKQKNNNNEVMVE